MSLSGSTNSLEPVFVTVLGAILGLVADATPPNSIPMRDGSGRRPRIGDYRVLYRIDGDDLTVHAVGHRKDVYN